MKNRIVVLIIFLIVIAVFFGGSKCTYNKDSEFQDGHKKHFKISIEIPDLFKSGKKDK